MKVEINEDFYCSADSFKNSICHHNPPQEYSCLRLVGSCKFYHRKWPTPDQYREEYGEEYAGHRPVWWKPVEGNGMWRTKSYRAVMGVLERAKREGGLYYYSNILIVCACTPWDRPPADWRPV